MSGRAKLSIALREKRSGRATPTPRIELRAWLGATCIVGKTAEKTASSRPLCKFAVGPRFHLNNCGLRSTAASFALAKLTDNADIGRIITVERVIASLERRSLPSLSYPGRGERNHRRTIKVHSHNQTPPEPQGRWEMLDLNIESAAYCGLTDSGQNRKLKFRTGVLFMFQMSAPVNEDGGRGGVMTSLAAGGASESLSVGVSGILNVMDASACSALHDEADELQWIADSYHEQANAAKSWADLNHLSHWNDRNQSMHR